MNFTGNLSDIVQPSLIGGKEHVSGGEKVYWGAIAPPSVTMLKKISLMVNLTE